MFLSSLWAENQKLLLKPAEFARAVGNRLEQLIEEDEPFAAAICGVLDLKQGEMRLVGAGNPPPLVRRAGGEWESPVAQGLFLGLMEGAEYEETVVSLHDGDSLLFYTDGVTEISGTSGELLGCEGLRRILEKVGYPSPEFPFTKIESELMASSNRIRFDDDLTFLDVQILSIGK